MLLYVTLSYIPVRLSGGILSAAVTMVVGAGIESPVPFNVSISCLALQAQTSSSQAGHDPNCAWRANVVNEAALLAARHNKTAVEMADFEEAISRIVAGLEKKQRVMSPWEQHIIAYHESGHALVAESLTYADRVHRISIIPRGIAALGYTLQLPTGDRYLMTRSELLDRLTVLLGGRSAEELALQEISTGAQDDLARATDIAHSMVLQYGMSEKIGPLTYEQGRRPMFLDPMTPLPRLEVSEETARAIDCEVRTLITEAHERARTILAAQRTTLDTLARLLLENETIEGDELRDIMAASRQQAHPQALSPQACPSSPAIPARVAPLNDREGARQVASLAALLPPPPAGE
jgi:ATP-dependent Zn protease